MLQVRSFLTACEENNITIISISSSKRKKRMIHYEWSPAMESWTCKSLSLRSRSMPYFVLMLKRLLPLGKNCLDRYLNGRSRHRQTNYKKSYHCVLFFMVCFTIWNLRFINPNWSSDVTAHDYSQFVSSLIRSIPHCRVLQDGRRAPFKVYTLPSRGIYA